MKKINIKAILKGDTKNIAAFIIAYRVLGCWKEEAKMCMIELAKRKAEGDTFDFETYILEGVKNYQFKINLNEVINTKNKFKGMLSQSILGVMVGIKGVGKTTALIDDAEDDDLDLED